MCEKQIVNNHSVLASWIRSICQTARSYGFDPIPLVIKSGLDPQLLNIPEARYPLDGVRTLWQLLIAESKDNLFGLSVGQKIQASALYSLGMAIMSCASLSDLMTIMARYCKVISTTSRISLTHTPEITTLTMKSIDGAEPMNSARLALMAFIYRQACSLSQHIVKPAFITLSMPYQENHYRLDEYFSCPVNLGAEVDSIAFHYADIIEPYASANIQLMNLNQTIVDKYLIQLDKTDICALVIHHIHSMIGKKEPKITDIADKLNLSVRTLQRRLKSHGCSFNELVDRKKRDIAHDLLAHTNQSITEIAFHLDFSDLSNFIRASKRWFGCTPAKHRDNCLKIAT